MTHALLLATALMAGLNAPRGNLPHNWTQVGPVVTACSCGGWTGALTLSYNIDGGCVATYSTIMLPEQCEIDKYVAACP